MIRPCIVIGTLGAASAETLQELRMSSKVSQLLEDFSSKLLGDPDERRSVRIASAMKAVEEHMDVRSAARVVAHKHLPGDVENMVQLLSQRGDGDETATPNPTIVFNESSLEKARIVLNEMIVNAWRELDDKLLQCKYFEQVNRDNHKIVVSDITRLIGQINDLERMESEAIEGINTKETEIKGVEDLLEQETRSYEQEYAQNSAELSIRQGDMDVFQFIMEFTKCKEGAVLSNEADLGNVDETAATTLAQVKVCQTSSGTRVLQFKDPTTNEKYEKLLTPVAKRQLDRLLRSFETSLLQHNHTTALAGDSGVPVGDSGEEYNTTKAPFANDRKMGAVGDNLAAAMSKQDPVQDGVAGIKAGLMCGPDSVPDCALLHDKLSLMWGEYKDQVDELTMEMLKNEYEFHQLKDNLNSQIEVLRSAKAKLNQLLAETRSRMAEDRNEQMDKEEQKRMLDDAYRKEMSACQKRINWIFYQDMCSIKVTRNAVMESSEICGTSDMIDCDVADWIDGGCTVDGSASGAPVPCDNGCPKLSDGSEISGLSGDKNDEGAVVGDGTGSKLFSECGGWKTMTREIVTPQDQRDTYSVKELGATEKGCGIPCPHTKRTQKCNQFKCAINCAMSEWSGWSKCSAECNGGVQGHTRSIMTKPDRGGLACGTSEEVQACATESCDRNCKLSRWTDFTPCSQACTIDGQSGFKEQFRHVVIPIRGYGKCPKKFSPQRYKNVKCNDDKTCREPMICVAKQDLVIAIDGSGSIRTMGFEVLKNFVKKLLANYQSEYWGDSAVKLGIVLFGNGEIMQDGKTVSPAILEQGLTFNHQAVIDKVGGLVFQRGFSNMAQAFSMAETAFIQGSRRGAQSAVMVVTDGKPSFRFQTTELVEQLDDKGVYRFFVAINDGDLNDDIKRWASQPWDTNVVHVPGLEVLESDPAMFAMMALVKFCPMAYSPSEMAWEEASYGYAHVKDGGYYWRNGKL
jgi:hypothetical protein